MSELKKLKKLNIIAPICGSQTSYSIVACNIICELEKLGVDCSVWPIGPVSFEDCQKETLVRCLERSRSQFYANSPCIRIFHQFSQDLFCGSPRIAFPVFELDKFTKTELHHLRQVDHIFVTSEWGESVCKANGLENVSVVPLGVDSTIFSPKLNTDKTDRTDKTTRFIFVGKTEIRKSCLEIVDIFNETFGLEDDVELWLLWHNIFETPENMGKWNEYAAFSKLGKVDKIKVIDRVQNQKQVAQLIQSCDCVVSLSHSEGWNFPILEGMACGKAVICTNCTAQTEFCNNQNALLIEMDEMEVAYDGKWFLGNDFDKEQGKWYKVGQSQLEQFKKYMLNVHKLKQNNKLELNQAGIETAKKFSWENTAKKIIEGINKL